MGKWIIIGLSLAFLAVVGIIMFRFRKAVNGNDEKVKKAAPLMVTAIVSFAVIVVMLSVCLIVFTAGR